MSNKLDNDRLLDNAATCSQYKLLVDNKSLRECIVLNIIDPLKTEIERLQAIVKKLPKTKDGVVVVPGMMLYGLATEYGYEKASVELVTVGGYHLSARSCNLARAMHTIGISEMFSTHEAAEEK